jgi:hypothetical protein
VEEVKPPEVILVEEQRRTLQQACHRQPETSSFLYHLPRQFLLVDLR